ncbi:minor capsid protein [Clostridium sp.]|uniref:minor capsid protein n=1 Tax=Clostridium sp. TaxID=1506 RepID=UPI001A478D1C|nr:minor capsid protein [Clostridium sp.]MBK5242057.1 minor capsid protein [Clostridium sp.]
MDKFVRDEIVKIKEEMMDKANGDVEEIKKEYKKYLLILIAFVSDYYNRHISNGKISNFRKNIILNDLEKKIKEYAQEIYNFQYEFIVNDLKDIYEETYFKNLEVLNEVKGMEVKGELIPDEIEEIINANYQGSNIKERLQNNITEFAEDLYKKIDRDIVNRKTLDEMITGISKTFEISTYDAKVLLNTEQTRIFTSAQEKVFINFEVEEIMWCADVCRNTCMYCEAMDGRIFKLNDENRPTIPAHPNCNCCWIPI